MARAYIEIGGVVVRDPLVKTTSTGKPMLMFSVRVDLGKGQYATTTYYSVKAFGELATTYTGRVAKGDFIEAAGTLELTKYTDRDGKPQSGLSVFASAIRDQSDQRAARRESAQRGGESES